MTGFDVIIASFYRSEVLAKCLASFPTNKPLGLGKLLVAVDKNDAATISVLKDFNINYPLEIIGLEQKLNPGATRNRCIDKATSNYLCFLDDDLVLPADYFNVAEGHVAQKNMMIFGGPDNSFEFESSKQKVLSELLGHPLFMGPTSKRHNGVDEVKHKTSEKHLTLCNMWMKRSIFEKDKLRFNESLRRCEENELLNECHSLGIEMWYIPKLIVFHLRRECLKETIKIQWLSGFYRGMCLRLQGLQDNFFFLIPWLVGLFLTLGWFINFETMKILILIHFLMMIFIIMTTKIKDLGLKAMGWSLLYGICIHTFFSLGLFWGTLLGRSSAKNTAA